LNREGAKGAKNGGIQLNRQDVKAQRTAKAGLNHEIRERGEKRQDAGVAAWPWEEMQIAKCSVQSAK